MSVLPARKAIFWGLPGSRLCWAAQLGLARGGSRVTGPGQLVKFCATIRPAGSLVDQSCFPSGCFTYTGAHFVEAESVSRAREHCSCKPPGPSFPRSAELMSVLRAWETTFVLPPGSHLGRGAQLGSARGSGPHLLCKWESSWESSCQWAGQGCERSIQAHLCTSLQRKANICNVGPSRRLVNLSLLILFANSF